MRRAYGRKAITRATAAPKHPRDWGARCDVCPLKGSKPVYGDGNRRASLAIIGEAPGREEVQVGIPFVGASGNYLENLLGRLEVSRTEVWVDNAIACFPPGGDLDAYLQRAKKEGKEAKLEWHHPVDCCRPRLFRALGIPPCKLCGKWLSGPDALVCRCPKPLPVTWSHHPEVPSVVAAGNAALRSLLGVTGITERRGYVEDMKARRKALRGK